MRLTDLHPSMAHSVFSELDTKTLAAVAGVSQQLRDATEPVAAARCQNIPHLPAMLEIVRQHRPAPHGHTRRYEAPRDGWERLRAESNVLRAVVADIMDPDLSAGELEARLLPMVNLGLHGDFTTKGLKLTRYAQGWDKPWARALLAQPSKP